MSVYAGLDQFFPEALRMTPSKSDFDRAISGILNGTFKGGEPWCPRTDALKIGWWLADRSKPLGGAIRQMVRFIRLMARAEGRDFKFFLYGRVETLRARTFQREIKSALENGKLIGVAELTNNGVRMLEPQLAVEGKAFELSFRQMPRLGALLDFLMNTLDPSIFDIFDSLTDKTIKVCPDDVARMIASKLNMWLTPIFDSSYRLRQAANIREFLNSTNRRPRDIDDDIILDLWICLSKNAAAEGFKKYTGAARLSIRFMQSSAVAEAEAMAFHSSGQIGSDDALNIVDLDRIMSSPLDIHATTPADFEQKLFSEADEWTSPFSVLLSYPSNRVKWLFRAEAEFLGFIFGDGAILDEKRDNSSLFGNNRFDIRFVKTLVRCTYFGLIQNTLIQSIKNGKTPSYDIVLKDYIHTIDLYKRLVIQCHLIVGASAFVLIKAGSIKGLGLAEVYLGDSYPKLISDLDKARTSEIDDVMKMLLEGAMDVENLESQKMRKAFSKVNRIGFKEEASDDQTREAFEEGCEAFVILYRELTRVTAALESIKAVALQDDTVTFDKSLREIYL